MYKRQEQNEDGGKRRNAAKKKELEATEKRIAELSAIFKRLYEDSVSAVSYTHLDVYKRQAYEPVKIDFPFEVEDVESVEMYHYDGVPASAEKKVVVAENDIKTLYLSLIHIS